MAPVNCLARSFERLPSFLGHDQTPLACVPRLNARAIRRLARDICKLCRNWTAARRSASSTKCRQLHVPGYLAPSSQCRLHPLPARPAGHRRLCWMTDFRSIRWANDMHIASVLALPQAHGSLEDCSSGPNSRSRLRRIRHRPGICGPAAPRRLWSRVGSQMPRIPPHRTFRAYCQRLTGAAACLSKIARSLEALRSRTGRPVRSHRPCGRTCQHLTLRPLDGQGSPSHGSSKKQNAANSSPTRPRPRNEGCADHRQQRERRLSCSCENTSFGRP